MADMLRLRLAVAVKEDGSGWTVLDDELFTRLAKLRLSRHGRQRPRRCR